MSPLFLYQHLLHARLDGEGEQIVSSWILEYPYFALPHYLKARQTKEKNALFRAALYAPNRTLLKRFMDGSMMLYEKKLANMFDDQTDIKLRKYSRANNNTFSILTFEESDQNIADEEIPFHVLVEGQKPYDVFLNYDVKVLTFKYRHISRKIGEQVAKFKAEYRNRSLKDNPFAYPLDAAKNPEVVSSGSQSRKDVAEKIIDEFLTQNPQISRPGPENHLHPDPKVIHSLEPDNELVTETLALLHLRQNNREEAIRIYKKLSLLFPEKSAYFESEMRKII